MRLLIIRHAVAVSRGTPGIADNERPLTPEGEERFARAARGLARFVPPPEVMLTSPLPRARRTAEIASEAWGGVDVQDEASLAGGSFTSLEKALSRYPDNASVAIVGHEPFLSELLAALVGASDGDPLTFRKGGAACVEMEGPLAEGGRLLWYIPPKMLRAYAKA